MRHVVGGDAANWVVITEMQNTRAGRLTLLSNPG